MARDSTEAPLHETIADRLIELGATDLFGLMGEDTAGLTTHLVQERGLKYRSARHENVAVTMAEGFGRASGSVGICLLSRGPGLTNSLTGLLQAERSGGSLLVLTGDVPSAHGDDGEAFDLKYMDQAGLLGMAGIRSETATTATEALDALEWAWRHASDGHVAVISIPADLLDEPAAADLRLPVGDAPLDSASPVAPAATVNRAVDKAAEILNRSAKPLIVAGRGAMDDQARQRLIGMAERSGALLGTSLHAKDLFRGHPMDLGIVGGFSHETARSQISEVDCVLAFGAGLNRFTTAGGSLFPESVAIIQIDRDATRLGQRHPIQVGIEGDVVEVADAVTKLLPEPDEETLRLRTAAARDALSRHDPTFIANDVSTATTIDPRRLMIELDRLLPHPRTVTVDCGHFVVFPSMHLAVDGPSDFRFCLDFGALAMGHGTAIGVACARPRSCNVLVLGDGGTMMTLGDLETAVRERIPLVTVIVNDGAFGAERHFLELAGTPGSMANMGPVDLAGVASALGARSATIRNVDDLERISPEFQADTDVPLVLDCKVDPDLRAHWFEEMVSGH